MVACVCVCARMCVCVLMCDFQHAHIVSDVRWHPKLLHQCLHKLGVTTFTCQVYSTTTILQVCDTNHDTVDKETESWLIPHFVHHILVNFVLCEQFTNNLLMAHATSQQEAVLVSLKEIGRHDITLVQKHKLHRTHLKGDGW